MISELTQSILLLTAYLPGGGKASAKPLTTKEYNRLGRWLNQQQLSPADLLSTNCEDILAKWQDAQLAVDRLRALMQRGASLAMAMDKWERAGMWVINRSEAQYPQRIKQTLKAQAPPVFFGFGNVSLLATPCIGVVGSRSASESDLALTRQLGKQVVDGECSIVSGGAKGVDEASMLGALEAHGTAVGFLADSLLKKASSRTYRDHLMNKQLVLLSPFSPEARFNVGNAMARNKYIYLQSQATVVIHSGLKGGTWTGAEENLKHQWVPLWVKVNDEPEAGNQRLIQMGGKALPEDPALWTPAMLVTEKPSQAEQGNLFEEQAQTKQYHSSAGKALYELFLQQFKATFHHEAVSPDRVSQQLALTLEQTQAWLEIATHQGQLEKIPPAAFRWK